MSKDVKCPYCKEWQEINHDDGYGYSESELHQQWCGKCSKNFVYTTSISFYYSAEQADCLNGAEHNWNPTNTIPKEFTRMECSMCGEERRPTEEEKITLGILKVQQP
jgi:hypothetical protein